jgi:predicted HD phosphohydrolase
MATAEQVSYRRLADITEDDMRLLEGQATEAVRALPDRLIAAVANLENFQGPVQVTRLEHSLQSATRAYRDGRDEQYVTAPLLHDIGDELAPFTHGSMVAAILRPFLNKRICWVVEKHGLFQAYYYAHLIGGDRNARDKYRDHPYYADCAEFCEKYDQNCFDPDYESLPLPFFEPMVRRCFSKPMELSDFIDDSE